MEKIKIGRTAAVMTIAASVFAGSLPAEAAQEYGLSVRMFGWADSTAAYAFAFPGFSFTNLSSPGIEITKLTMDDGSAIGLWDYVSHETASAGVTYNLTQGDRTNDSGWVSNIGYSFGGLGAGKFMEFYVDPDTLHSGTGNVVDARPYVFNGGKVTASFSNGQELTLTWDNPVAQSFSPLRRLNLAATDQRNIYYEMGQTITVAAPVPEPESYAMMLAGLGLMGIVARRRKQKLSA